MLSAGHCSLCIIFLLFCMSLVVLVSIVQSWLYTRVCVLFIVCVWYTEVQPSVLCWSNSRHVLGEIVGLNAAELLPSLGPSQNKLKECLNIPANLSFSSPAWESHNNLPLCVKPDILLGLLFDNPSLDNWLFALFKLQQLSCIIPRPWIVLLCCSA